MAHVDQTKKAKIAAALKLVVPAGWKYSLAVDNHSTIRMTIASAPVDLLAALVNSEDAKREGYHRVNHYHYLRAFRDAKMGELFGKIIAALNTDNHDNSDLMTDYFDVGHYVDISIGRWNKPFTVTTIKAKQAA